MYQNISEYTRIYQWSKLFPKVVPKYLGNKKQIFGKSVKAKPKFSCFDKKMYLNPKLVKTQILCNVITQMFSTYPCP